MSTFIGQIAARLDDKGRTFIPASYRKILAEKDSRRVVVRLDSGLGCLQFYPEDVWDKRVEELSSKLSPWKMQDRLFLVEFTGSAEFLETDSQGRVLIQKRLLEQIGAEQDVLFVGMLDCFTLWSPTRYEEAMLPPADFEEAISKRMSDK